MSIVLVRHGETDSNTARVLQTADTPLNVLGMRQAEQLARRLAAMDIAHVLCSDLPRALMTAAPFRALRPEVSFEASPLLQERNFGDVRGTPYAALGRDPFGPDYAPPGGESWEMFYARVAEAFALIATRKLSLPEGNLLVVTHGLVCRALLQRHVPAPEPPPERFDNTSVTLLDARAPHTAQLVNCCAHLETGGREGGPA